ncbi:MAG: hypothetical protein PHV68_02610 [Candidatus Gastranaerophilales bacterium]|nr:hypothetical protein [Candidatus Gastranaerophilales bacterium]
MKKSRKELENREKSLTKQIDLFKKNIKKVKISDRTYNKMLLERAICRKALEEKDSESVFIRLAKKLAFRKKSEPKLICDYFNS